MQYRYRVIGKVIQPFILRGAYFIKNSTMDFCITEKELEFVKERCNLEKVLDLSNEDNSVSKSTRGNGDKTVSTAQSAEVDKSIKPTPKTPVKRQYTRHTANGDK